MPSHAEELRAAAAGIRARAEKATPGRWWSRYGGEAGFIYSSGGHRLVATIEGEKADDEPHPNSEHIATWSPEPALAVAAYLEQTADRHAPHQLPTAPDYAICSCSKGKYHPVVAPCPDMAAALAVARAIAGGGAA